MWICYCVKYLATSIHTLYYKQSNVIHKANYALAIDIGAREECYLGLSLSLTRHLNFKSVTYNNLEHTRLVNNPISGTGKSL